MVDTRRRTNGRRVAEAEVETPVTDLPAMPSTERIQQELATAKSLDDFFGKEGIFARLGLPGRRHRLRPYVALMVTDRFFDVDVQTTRQSFASRYNIFTLSNGLYARVVFDESATGIA